MVKYDVLTKLNALSECPPALPSTMSTSVVNNEPASISAVKVNVHSILQETHIPQLPHRVI